MARGICSNWKQPVYMDFDAAMTKDILNSIISLLHEINFNVVACVSDCGPTNQGLWKSLNISIERTHFEHKVTSDPIYVFGDTPHMLKLIRNNWLDRGYQLKDGICFQKHHLEEIIKKTDAEISSGYHLLPLTIHCSGNERQNVGLAKNLLSHKTAVLTARYFSNKPDYIALSKFVDLVNSWYDVMSSTNVNESQCFKKPYGINLGEQNKLLDDMYETMLSMRGICKKALYPFQKYIMISITSIKMLYQSLKEKFPQFRYLLTHRLNQDVLENLFSQLRTRGGNDDHPSPLNAMYRLRMITLGKTSGIVKSNMCTVDTSMDEFLMTKVLRETTSTTKPLVNVDKELQTSECSDFDECESSDRTVLGL